jgi:hypothetical protein
MTVERPLDCSKGLKVERRPNRGERWLEAREIFQPGDFQGLEHSWTMRVGLKEDEGTSSSSSLSPCSDWIAYKNYTPIHRPWRDFYYSSARLLPVRWPAAALMNHSHKRP